MKKVALGLVMVSIGVTTSAAHAYPEGRPNVQVNGQPLQSSVAPLEMYGHTSVSLRDIFVALGAKVTYNSKERVIIVEHGSTTIQFPLSGGGAKMNCTNMNLKLEQMPMVRNGTAMLPLRFAAELMGAQVAHVQRETDHVISITSKSE